MKKLTILLLILTLGFLSAEAKKEKEEDIEELDIDDILTNKKEAPFGPHNHLWHAPA